MAFRNALAANRCPRATLRVHARRLTADISVGQPELDRCGQSSLGANPFEAACEKRRMDTKAHARDVEGAELLTELETITG